MSYKVYDQKFYYRFLSRNGKIGLDSEEMLNEMSFVVCWEKHNKPRLFTFFKSVNYFVSWMINKVPKNEWCFHEITRQNVIQRLRYDIDIDVKELFQEHDKLGVPRPDVKLFGDNIQSVLIDAVAEVIKEKGFEFNIEKDVTLCDSSGPFKFSRHVFFPNHSTSDSENASLYYDLIMKKCPPNFGIYVDQGIYGAMHNLRLLASVKLGTTRVKLFQEKWLHHGKEITYEYPENPETTRHKLSLQFEMTTITNALQSNILPYLESTRIKKIEDTIDDQLAIDVFTFYAKSRGVDIGDARLPYSLTGASGNVVVLKRTKPSNCPICIRIHENENPFLVVSGPTNNVSFHCRRTQASLQVGEMNPENSIDIGTLVGDIDIMKSISSSFKVVSSEEKNPVTDFPEEPRFEVPRKSTETSVEFPSHVDMNKMKMMTDPMRPKKINLSDVLSIPFGCSDSPSITDSERCKKINLSDVLSIPTVIQVSVNPKKSITQNILNGCMR
jgi:hypothetical protein